MIRIKKYDCGAAVEDVQQRLAKLHFLAEEQLSGVFDDALEEALAAFCLEQGLEATGEVDDTIWAALVDACYELGDRTLYLRMPYFHGNDVLQLQTALTGMGFACGEPDGIFGAYTESALRKFQMNLGLFTDGIAGAYTFDALLNLHYSWEGKARALATAGLGFARAADVLESQAVCLFGTCEFTRSVASRMSNLALATNPASKVISADSLSVPPTEGMLLVHIVLPESSVSPQVPCVAYEEEATLALRLGSALRAAHQGQGRIAVELPGETWIDAGAGRSAQHFAITLLDALCSALSTQASSPTA